jgi:serine/threonine-protein kinase
VAISPLDGLTLVTNFNGNSNSVSSFNIPATTGATSTSVGVGSGPVAVAIDPVGLTAAVADASSNQITLLDISSGSPTVKGNNNGPNQPAGVVFDPVNKVYILTSSLGNALIFLDPVSQQLRAARIGINPTSIAYNFQTSTIVTVNSLSSTVSMMDINDQRVKANFGLKGSLLGAAAIHPRTNLVYIADQQNSRLLIVPLPF